ncbi:MAG: CPBP family intramembrane metalloprotease [Clostridiales bacterium]|nr:CPBP family intramembrane metalloprotease [Clostridiales bacterium]
MEYYSTEKKGKSIFKIFLIYYVVMLLFCGLRIFAQLGYVPDGIWGDILFSFLVQVVILVIIPSILFCLFFKSKPKRIFKDCNFGKINIQIILISIGLGLICFVVNIIVSSLFNGILSYTGYRFNSSGSSDYSDLNFIIDIITVAILPAIAEEFLHRGLLLQGIKHIGFKKAIVISSLMFGLIHFNIQQVSYAIIVGLIMGFASVVAKNIFPAIIIHFLNNFLSTYLSYASNRGWIGGNILGKLQLALFSGNTFMIFFVSAIVVIVVVALLFLLIWLLYKQSIVRKVNHAIDKVYKSSGEIVTNKPVYVEEEKVIRELIETNTLLNLDYQKMDNPINIVMPKEKAIYKWSFKDKIFMWGAFVLSGLVTLFTYIWGLF